MERYVVGGCAAAAVAAVVSCASMSSLAARPQAMAGTWEGLGVQAPVAGQESWPVRITLDARGDGAIAYPTLECGGPLTRLRSIGNTVVYREVIAYGAERCMAGGTVTVVADRGKLFWYWTGEATEEPEVAAAAVLTRAAAPVATR
jgi:hypothetical protein